MRVGPTDRFCPNCGRETTEQAAFCAACGRALGAPGRISATEPPVGVEPHWLVRVLDNPRVPGPVKALVIVAAVGTAVIALYFLLSALRGLLGLDGLRGLPGLTDAKAEQTENAVVFRSAVREQFAAARNEPDWRLDELRRQLCAATSLQDQVKLAKAVSGVHTFDDATYVVGAASVAC
jgi:hypothetical protein